MKILITGGASGLGAAITKRLAKEQDNTVYFTYSSSEAKAKEIELEFSNTIAIKCNFKKEEEITLLKEKIKNLDFEVLINNAYSGAPIKTYFHKMLEADFAHDFNDNILPTISITQSCLSNFRKKKYGKIITILTSFLLNTPPVGASSYVASKAYLASMVKSWATENAKFNISSNSVSPSFMITGLTDEVDERVVEQIIEGHPLKKLLTKEEVAETVLFLTISSSQINGIDLVINAASNIK